VSCYEVQAGLELTILLSAENTVFTTRPSLELIFYNVLGFGSRFFFVVVTYTQLFQQYLLNRLSFLQLLAFTFWPKINWTYLCNSISWFSVLDLYVYLSYTNTAQL
jgi:hypothetical protein